MSSAQNPDADREEYVVSVVEFAGDAGAATAALQRVFGLEEAAARALLNEVPVAVRRGVNRIRAEYFRRALELSGARVEVRNAAGEIVAAPSSGTTRAQPNAPILRAPQPSARADPSPPLAATPKAGAPQAWGDLQPFKPAAPAAKPAVDPVPNPPVADAPKQDWALSLAAAEGPLDSPLARVARAGSLELASQTAASPSAARRSPDDPRTVEFESSGEPQGPALELDFERGRSSDRASPRQAIPAGEPWRAPGARTLAKAQHKQAIEALGSGLGELRPTSDPRALAGSPPPARPASGPLRVRAPSGPLRPPTAEVRGATPRAPARIDPQRSPRHARDTVKISLGAAARTALSGTALAWVGAIWAGAACIGGAAALSMRLPLIGLPILLATVTGVLGLCATYHRLAFWAAATQDTDIAKRPTVSVALMIREGAHLAGLALVTQLLLWVWIGGELRAGHGPLTIATSPTLWFLGIGPGFYWPIALACSVARNRASSVWSVSLGLRALGRGPSEVMIAVVATGLAFMVVLLTASALLSPLDIDVAFALGIAGGPALALGHGLAGAWMGRALRARPDLFE